MTNLRVSNVRPEGMPITVDLGYLSNGIAVQNNTMRPIVACRQRAAASPSTNIFVESINAMATSGANARWACILNPNLEIGGVPTTWDSLAWTQEGTSEVEYHRADATYEVIPDGSGRIASGYTSNNRDFVRDVVGYFLTVTTDPFVLCVEGLSNETWFGEIQLRDVT